MDAPSTAPFMFARLPGLVDRLAQEATEAAKHRVAELRLALAPRPAPERLERLERLPPKAPPFNWVRQLCGNIAPRLASQLLASKRVDSPGPLPPPHRPAESSRDNTIKVNNAMVTAPIDAAPPIDAVPPINDAALPMDDAAQGPMVRASPPHQDSHPPGRNI